MFNAGLDFVHMYLCGQQLCWLCRWRGSIYKLIWRDFLLYVLLYYAITLLYSYVLVDPSHKVYVSFDITVLSIKVSVIIAAFRNNL